jgi:hypothetical protein
MLRSAHDPRAVMKWFSENPGAWTQTLDIFNQSTQHRWDLTSTGWLLNALDLW